MPTANFHVAQVNVARARGQSDEPVMAEFMAALPEINALAERSPGFVWRLQKEDGDATAIRPYGDPLILINLSVWRDLDALREYVFRSDHAGYMRRWREWFERFERVYVAMWWVPPGHIPTIGEAVERLADLEAHGPTPVAFGFAQPFGAELPAAPERYRRRGCLSDRLNLRSPPTAPAAPHTPAATAAPDIPDPA